jgi:hypothetical protein
MMILSQYHIFELDTINIYSAGRGTGTNHFPWGLSLHKERKPWMRKKCREYFKAGHFLSTRNGNPGRGTGRNHFPWGIFHKERKPWRRKKCREYIRAGHLLSTENGNPEPKFVNV